MTDAAGDGWLGEYALIVWLVLESLVGGCWWCARCWVLGGRLVSWADVCWHCLVLVGVGFRLLVENYIVDASILTAAW